MRCQVETLVPTWQAFILLAYFPYKRIYFWSNMIYFYKREEKNLNSQNL